MVNYLYNNSFVLLLNDDLPFNINTHLIVPFAIVVSLCFIVMIGFMIMKCLREQRRLRRHRLPGSVLKKIPIIRFNKEEHMSLYEICAICIEDYVDGDRLRVLPCAHGESFFDCALLHPDNSPLTCTNFPHWLQLTTINVSIHG